jgi:transcriptional regulator with XRE-family HTH domain
MKIIDTNNDRQPQELTTDGTGIQTISVTSLEVRKIRKSLGLTVDHFGLLLGVSPSSIFRYENIGVNAFHQGPVARKLALLIRWIDQNGRAQALRSILTGPSGLAVLAGLLETGSVMSGGLPFEAFAGDAKAENRGQALPSVESLADAIVRALKQTAGLTEGAAATPQGGQDAGRAAVAAASVVPEDQAGRMEAEARIMEAEARKLEAQARKLEALVRIRAAGDVSDG